MGDEGEVKTVEQQKVFVPRQASAVSKGGFVMAAVALLGTIWGVVGPILPQFGVSPTVQKQIDDALKLANAHSDDINSLEQQIRDFQSGKVKPNTPTPIDPTTPVVSPEMKALQDQIQQLKDLLAQQNKPKDPLPVTPLASAVKAVDSQGKPVSDSIDPGRQFFVQAASKDGTFSVMPKDSPDIDYKIYADEVSVVLRNGASVTVFHASGSPITTSSLIVKCNQAAQPPPVVKPVQPNIDPVNPSPAPVPSTGFNTSAAANALADEAEKANASPAFKASAVVQGILNMGGTDFPPEFVQKVKAAVPVIDKTPAVDLTADQVAAIRSVR